MPHKKKSKISHQMIFIVILLMIMISRESYFFSPTSPPGRPDIVTTASPYDQRPGSPYDQRPGSPYATPSYPYATDYPYGRPTTQSPPTPMTTTPPRPELGYLEVRIDLQRSRFPLNEQVILQQLTYNRSN